MFELGNKIPLDTVVNLCNFISLHQKSNVGSVCVHRRERSKVPYIVRQCIEEVEKRGIDEVGIYRISGVATDIQALKTAFDTSKTLFSSRHLDLRTDNSFFYQHYEVQVPKRCSVCIKAARLEVLDV